ncbi:MAG: Spy/CpxP family protein refolding chaperone [Alphaproteobacteria bacterium]|nr:Spy/CpxP family protein refolding chaperone [Alphaproteobacteria bacterium]
MLHRPLLLAVPLALMTAASLSFVSPAMALDGGGDDPFELAQATPPASPPPAAPGAGPERRDDRRAFNPRAFCLDRIAHRAGNRAAVKVRLELKPEQMTAWNAFAKAADDADAKDIARCNALPTEMKDRPTYLQRLDVEEQVMKARVERIEAVKPTLQAVYDTLSPEQKAVLDQPRPMGGMMRHGRPGPR